MSTKLSECNAVAIRGANSLNTGVKVAVLAAFLVINMIVVVIVVVVMFVGCCQGHYHVFSLW